MNPADTIHDTDRDEPRRDTTPATTTLHYTTLTLLLASKGSKYGGGWSS